MCNRVLSKVRFSIRHVPDQCKTQQMCDEAVDDCLAALKFVPDGFVTRKKLENLDNALQANDDILFNNKDFNKITFNACQRHIFAADLDKIKFDNGNNFSGDDLATLIHVRVLAYRSNFEKKITQEFACQKMSKKK